MPEMRERSSSTVSDLSVALSEFIASNRHSRDVKERWLATQAAQLLTIVKTLRDPSADHKKAISEFRAAEIELGIASKRGEVDALERDLARARSEAAA